ncbi:MAG: ThuA domain-containing protein [Caulobacterales bacterium]|nr:ThuA domain-containing protein [Caulobacterales bacterium]
MEKRAVNGLLIAGGEFHDIDYARRALLDLLADHEVIRCRVGHDYRSVDALDTADFLVTYTCNVAPAPSEVEALRRFVDRGGRWLALHGTNSILAQNEAGRWYAPEDETGFMELLGSQFAAHPPIAPYTVAVQKPDDPLAAGLGDFLVEGGDELYYMRRFGEVDVVMDAPASGPAKGFAEREWPDGERHPVLYRKAIGAGEIVYFTLGHRRGHYDMAPLMDYYPNIEAGAWTAPAYQEILRRAIAWAAGV